MTPPLHLDTQTIVADLLIITAGIFISAIVFQADLNRRKIRANAYLIVTLATVAGLVAVFATTHIGLAGFACLLAWFLSVVILAPRKGASTFDFLDAASIGAGAGCAVVSLGMLLVISYLHILPSGLPENGRALLTELIVFLVWLGIAVFLWRMGTKATLGPKPSGEIFSVYLLFDSASDFVSRALRTSPPSFLRPPAAQMASLVTFVVGGLLLWFVLAKFHKIGKERRILEHTVERGEILQPEYRKPTPECPNPERWHMFDSMTAEVEVLDFLKTLVTTVKPELVVETGTFLGISTLRIAQGLRENGFGRVISCELDPTVYEEAKKRFAGSGLAEWIDVRNESSLEMKVGGRIDMLYSDSDLPLREQEVRRFLPQMNPHGLILMHDASSDLKTVREAALKLEREGLLSVVLLPTPRGLVVAQKRDGRK
ncbi:MAG: class I SAM-dependent methyltransferase [Candidatus Acidiferrales bacterium]